MKPVKCTTSAFGQPLTTVSWTQVHSQNFLTNPYPFPGNIAYYSFLGMAILIPTICFLFCYISIIIFVRRHVNVMSASITTTTTATFPSQSPGPEQRIARNKKTLRLILGLIFLNLTCRLPVWLFVVITNIKVPTGN